MPSWQSELFRRFSRLSQPRVAAGAAADIAELRRQYTYLSDRFGAAPGDVAFEGGHVGPIKGEWVRCGPSTADRLILYFHGGGYIAGSPETHRPLIARLTLHAEKLTFQHPDGREIAVECTPPKDFRAAVTQLGKL